MKFNLAKQLCCSWLWEGRALCLNCMFHIIDRIILFIRVSGFTCSSFGPVISPLLFTWFGEGHPYCIPRVAPSVG